MLEVGAQVRLGIVYHMPFWQAVDGSLWEVEGSFARYVDSLAPYFDEVSLCVPVFATPQAGGTRLQAANVRLEPLPFFDGPRHFYPRLAVVMARLWRWVPRLDVLHCRVPTPAAYPAFLAARWFGKPVMILVVGDLQALLPTMPYRGLKKLLWRAYTAFEEMAGRRMARRSLTFANGAALADKYARHVDAVVETTTTTIGAGDIVFRDDTCGADTVRVLTVSRIDPRKGLRCLPEAIALLRAGGVDVELDIIGPVVGSPGETERQQIVDDAVRRGVGDHVHALGGVPLQELLARYRQYDLFVLPTLPGEGIPRVLLEAMAAGIPVVTTRVAGIPSLIAHEQNGLLIEESSAATVAAAVRRLVDDRALRMRLIQGGYVTARAHTLEGQAAQMAAIASARLGVALRRPAAASA